MGFQYKVTIEFKNINNLPAKSAKTKVIDSFKKFNIECKYEDENTLVFLNSDPDKDMYAFFALALDEIYEDKELLEYILSAKAYEDLSSDAFVDIFEEYREFDLEYGKD